MDLSNITKQARKILKPKYCGAVIVAAGTASRMGGIDKVMAPINGEPMIVHSVRAFQKSDVIDEIVIVTRQDLVTPIMNLCQEFDKVQVVTVGGSSRPESVAIGLNSLSGKVKLAAIHDGARPLITDAVIDRTVRAANSCGAAAPAVPVKDTIKSVAGDIVKETPDRSLLRAVQTPQVFDADFLQVALANSQRAFPARDQDNGGLEFVFVIGHFSRHPCTVSLGEIDNGILLFGQTMESLLGLFQIFRRENIQAQGLKAKHAGLVANDRDLIHNYHAAFPE